MIAATHTTGTLYRNAYRREGNELVLHVVGRGTDGSKIDADLLGTRPHFYIDSRESDKIPGVPLIVGQEPGPISSDGRPTLRVFTSYPYEVREARQSFGWSGEADIVYPTRVRLDWSLTHVEIPKLRRLPVSQVHSLAERPVVTPWVMTLDIETDDSDGFPRPENPTAPITAISWHDDHLKKYGLAYVGPEVSEADIRSYLPRPIAEPVCLFPRATEADLLWGFGHVLRQMDPDAVTSWNGYRYDYPYLMGRAARLQAKFGPNAEIQRVQDTFFASLDEGRRRSGNIEWSYNQNHGRAALVDSLQAYRKNEMRQISFALEAVAQEVLGYGKVQRPAKVSDLFAENLSKGLAYALWDTSLVVQIEARKKLVPLILRWAETSCIEATDTLNNSRIFDGYLFRTARKHGPPRIVLPTSKANLKLGKSRGPVVFQPPVGAFEYVVVFDMKQCYPSLIASFWISPDARVETPEPGTIQLPTGGIYREGGIVCEAMIDLMKLRDEAKRYALSLKKGTPEREDADTSAATFRHVVNSGAGVQTMPYWRMFDPVSFENITGMSRELLLRTRAYIEDAEWLGRVTGQRVDGKVLYGDTDSIIVHFTENGNPIVDFDRMKGIAYAVREALNEDYPVWVRSVGGRQNYIAVGVDGILDRFHTLPLKGTTDEGAKKRYYGSFVLEKDQDVRDVPIEKRLKIVGVEYRRWNNAPATREVQFGVMRRFCEGESVEQIREWVDTRIAEVPDQDLWCACKMGKESFDMYDSKQPFVRAMMAWSKLTGREVHDEDEFRWALVKRVTYRGEEAPGVRVFAVPLHLTDAEVRGLGLDVEIDRPSLEKDHWFDEAEKVLPELAVSIPSLRDWA